MNTPTNHLQKGKIKMKITIDGHNFDTEKAKAHWTPTFFDNQSNSHDAELYLNSTGLLYGNGLSQWANMHGPFEIMTAQRVLEEYGNALKDEEKAEIARVGKLEWE